MMATTVEAIGRLIAVRFSVHTGDRCLFELVTDCLVCMGSFFLSLGFCFVFSGVFMFVQFHERKRATCHKPATAALFSDNPANPAFEFPCGLPSKVVTPTAAMPRRSEIVFMLQSTIVWIPRCTAKVTSSSLSMALRCVKGRLTAGYSAVLPCCMCGE